MFLHPSREQLYSRIVEVEKGQSIVTTGPYAIVRHPMYFGVLVMFLFTPLALGSFWGLLAFLPQVQIIVFRIRDEEEELVRALPGYAEYQQIIQYRLIPFIWKII